MAEAAPQGAQRVIERKQGFGVRDLVSVGIFTVVNLVVFYLCAMTGIVPIMAFLYPLPIALLLGIPNMLFFTKAHRFGMVTVIGTLLGLFLINQGPLALVFGFVMSLASDLILRAGTYRSARCAVAAHCVFSLWTVGTMLPMWILGQAYFEPFRASQTILRRLVLRRLASGRAMSGSGIGSPSRPLFSGMHPGLGCGSTPVRRSLRLSAPASRFWARASDLWASR